jgi:hypothetical protein
MRLFNTPGLKAITLSVPPGGPDGTLKAHALASTTSVPPNGFDCPDYATLKAEAKSRGHSVKSLHALSPQNDPFYIGQQRQKNATWFHRLWIELGLTAGAHIRRVHYRLVSIAGTALPDGRPYENTDLCWHFICNAGRDARYRGLIPPEFVIDRRNPEAKVFFAEKPEEPPEIGVGESGLLNTLFDAGRPELIIPELSLAVPVVNQRYVVETWCEKSTINDILLPLAQRYRCNVVTGVGETSYTRCNELVARARKHGLPVRILYLSDFDPGGESMPTAAARKIEFAIRTKAPDLDVQIRSILLTKEQCDHYGLPRIPLKESEKRAAKFEERHGGGGTELDALEALHPGEIEQLLITEIERYYDTTLDERLVEVAAQAKSDLENITEEVHARYADRLLFAEWSRDATAARIRQLQEQIAEEERRLEERIRPLFETITSELDAEATATDDYNWPDPEKGDEDDDPLFDSTRAYDEQMERYREHQGKAEEDVGRKMTLLTCVICGESFEAQRSDAKTCSKACREKRSRQLQTPSRKFSFDD